MFSQNMLDLKFTKISCYLILEAVSPDWFDDLDQRDKDNAVQLLSQSLQHYDGLNQDVIMDMETKFGIISAQTQQLYELLYPKGNVMS